MKFLSRAEEYILLTIQSLGENAYAVAIRKTLNKATGKDWAYGALFITLQRLEQKSLVESYLTDPLPQRGGKSKRIFKVSKQGILAVNEVRNIQESIWTELADTSGKS